MAMKKNISKALALAVMMSVLAGGSAYAVGTTYYGENNMRIYDENHMTYFELDSIRFYSKYTTSGSLMLESRYYNGGFTLLNPEYSSKTITMSVDSGLKMGGLDIANVKDITATGTIKAGSGEIKSGETVLVNGGAVYTALQGYVEKGTETGIGAEAIGSGAQAKSLGSVAIGSDATANGNYSIAVGKSTANGVDSIAIGGTTTLGRSVALGRGSETSLEKSVAVGYTSTTKAVASTAIGFVASVSDTATNSVAIGAFSVATEANTVSVGSGNASDEYGFRKIVNVAAGENDTDVVNFSQIKAVDGNYVKATQTVAENFTALDDQVKTNADNIAALKSDMSTAKGDISTLKGDMSTAKGDISTLKSDVGALDTRVGAVEGDVSTLKSDMSTAKGDISTLKSDMSTAKGDISTLKSDVGALDTRVGTVEGDVSTLKTNVSALDTRVTAVEGFAGDISALQSDVANNKTDISNLKSDVATNKTDISKLKSDVANKANQSDLNAEETARKDADANLQSQIDAIGSGSSAGMAELNNKINATNDRVDRVGATAAALAGINYQPMAKGQSQVAIGMGGYKGKKATALGLAYQFNDRVSGSVAGAANGSERMFNVGFNYLFGQHSDKDIAQCAAAPGSVSLKEAEMQSTIDAQGAKINTLEAEIAELKAMVKALVAK